MIIVSQNKDRMITFQHIEAIYYSYRCYGIYAIYVDTNNEKQKVIGEYNSKEATLKVMEMIKENYQHCKMCECGMSSIAETEFVFQMPEKEFK